MNRIKQGATVWAVTGALLLAWFFLAAGANAGAEDRARDAIARHEKVERFYLVVDGDLSGQEPGPANRLARDLRELPAEGLASFSGDSNRYGGITEELSFDPFNGVDCSECGPLDREVQENVETIKNGNLDEVLQQLEAEVEPADTAPEPPGFIWVLWAMSLPVGVGALYVFNRRAEESKYRDYVGERALVHSLREVARELPDTERWETAHLADQLEAQIEMRVDYKESKVQEMKLDSLIEEASKTLEAISAGNKELN